MADAKHIGGSNLMSWSEEMDREDLRKERHSQWLKFKEEREKEEMKKELKRELKEELKQEMAKGGARGGPSDHVERGYSSSSDEFRGHKKTAKKNNKDPRPSRSYSDVARERDRRSPESDMSYRDRQLYGNFKPPTATRDSQFLECDLCSKRFSRRDNLIEHRRLHTGIGLVSCEHCPMKCPTQARLRKHMKKHTVRRSFPCPQCDKEFVTERYLGIHILTHTDEQLPYPCELCGKAFSRSNSLTSHMNSHMKRFPCSRCSMVFPSDRLLKIHRRTHKMMCDMCKMNFETMEVLGMHFEEYHPGMEVELPSQEEPTVAEEKQSLSCETCDKEFSRISHFKAHMNTHLKSFPCSRCSNVFPSERQLKKHRKTCQMSGSGDEEEEKQKEAVDAIASEEEPEEAEAASEEESDEAEKVSVKKEPQGDSESWPCKLCGEDFSRKKSLEIHLRTHTINFPCKRCHLMFPSERLMKKHRKIHKTTCKICSMGFETGQMLQEHYLDVHPESKKAKVNKDPLEGI